ncbi:hypothetical protein L2D14_15790 [Thalassospiraceae bacterium LMO-JJ14]|nr:hypothetical protein L2D14_15790 [Thalassospiraceae bacterium LMO-JJ14]
MFTFVTGIAGLAAAQQRAVPLPLEKRQGAEVNILNLTQSSGDNVNLEIVSACVQGTATFKIVNLGDKWPQLGKLKVYHILEGQTKEVSARQMRFARGQKASFRMKNIGAAHIGLFVEPSWYNRPFQYDAEVACK